MAISTQFSDLLKTGEIRLATVLKFDKEDHFYTSTGAVLPGLIPANSGEVRPWLLEDVEWPSQEFDEVEWKSSSSGISFSLIDYDGTITTLLSVDGGVGVFDNYVDVWIMPEHPEARFGTDSAKLGRFLVDYEVVYHPAGGGQDGLWKFSTSSMLALLEKPLEIEEGRCSNRDDLGATGGSAAGDTTVKNVTFMPEIDTSTNLVTNGGWETGDLTGWTTDAGSPSVGTTDAYAGTYSLEGLGTFTISQVVKTSGVKVGDVYRFGVYSKKEAGFLSTGFVKVQGLDSGSSMVEEDQAISGSITQNWHSSNIASLEITDSSVTQIKVIIQVATYTGNGTTDQVFFDEAICTSCVKYALNRREIMSYFTVDFRAGSGGAAGTDDSTTLSYLERSLFDTSQDEQNEDDEILHCAVWHAHPLKILLQMLCYSEQGGNAHELNCGYSLGLRHDIIDLDGIKDLFTTATEPYEDFADYVFSFRRTEPIESVKEYVEEHILKPIGARFYITTEGKISVKVYRDPRTATLSLSKDDAVGLVGVTYDHDALINQVKWEFDFDSAGVVDNAQDTKYLSEVTYLESDFGDVSETPSNDLYGEKELEIRSEGLRGYETAAMGLGLDLDGHLIAYNTTRILMERLSDPRAKYTIEVPLYKAVDYTIGDDALFTHADMPNMKTGTVGLTNLPCEIIKWEPTSKGTIKLELAHVYVRGGFQAISVDDPDTAEGGAATITDVQLNDGSAQYSVTQLRDLGLKNYPIGDSRPFVVWHNYGGTLKAQPTWAGWKYTEVWASDNASTDFRQVGVLDANRDFMAFSWPLDDSTVHIKIRYVNVAFEKGSYSGTTSQSIATLAMDTRYSGRSGVRQRVTPTKFYRYR